MTDQHKTDQLKTDQLNMDDDRRSVAVIGMACRFAGAETPEQLWDVLRGGADTTGETPTDRYDAAARGQVGSNRAGYLERMADFDAEFFDLSDAEATCLDPQHRLLLMTTWEALEDAGQRPDRLAGGATGVFVGNTRGDFVERQFRTGLSSITPAALHNFRSTLPARLSYHFDLRGPSLTVDTACSSSLTAIHLAVQSLRAQESPLAIAAGVNLPLRADESVLMTRAGTLAGDGRSKFGDADADGFAPSDGVGVVILKPLAAARADGDRIRAVIRGSAIGNDGRTGASLLTPSREGQVDALRRAYRDAGVAPSAIDFVEAHGSGAPTQDAVELEALGEVLGMDRPVDRPCYVGSVKSNIGYAEAAGGIAGLIKTVLSLEHGLLPASLHHHRPTPRVDWDQSPLSVPTRTVPLPERGRPTVAGVSGQGSTAMNAHLVVEQHIPDTRSVPPSVTDDSYPLVLSAQTPAALRDLVGRFIGYLAPEGAGRSLAIRDICYSAAIRRQLLTYRLVATGGSHRQLATALGQAFEHADPGRQHRAAAAVAARPGLFGPNARFVPLPTYPWQLTRYWPEEPSRPKSSDDLATELLRHHARTAGGEADESVLLAEIGIDSLAQLEITIALAEDFNYHADPEELAGLRTVGDLRSWVGALQGAG